MPYRVPEPREAPEPPAPAREPGFRCTRCGATFDASESEPRCPSCLRRSAVVAAGAPGRAPDLPLPDGSRAPMPVAESRLWPLGSDCPLCAARRVDDSLFYLHVSKHRGYASNSVTARGRCCRECRARVEALARLRRLSLPFVLGGFIAWPFSMTLDLFGSGVGPTIALATVFCGTAVAVPLVLLFRTQRALRRTLEETTVFLRMRDAVPTPRGLIGQEHWSLFAKPHAGAKVVEMESFVRDR